MTHFSFNLSQPLRNALRLQVATGEAWGNEGQPRRVRHPSGTLGIAETTAAPPRTPNISPVLGMTSRVHNNGPEHQNRHGTHYRHDFMP